MEATADKAATKVEQGKFLWHELLTKDADAAIDFYTHVVGWTTQPYDFQGETDVPDYTMWMAGDAPVGGVMQIDPQTMGDAPSGWSGYIHAPDLDATIEKAKSLGGTVIQEPMDVPTVGRMAELTDPQGAVFWILEPGSSEPMPEPSTEGSFTWNELATTDSGAAFDFYRQLFGWELLDDMDMGGGQMYRIFGQGEIMQGAVYDKSADMPARPHWLFYVNVADLDAALDRVRERGGKVVMDAMEVPGGDRVAPCMDPEGVAFALHEKKK